MPLEEIDGLQVGDPVEARSEDARVEVGPGLLGRVIDGFGKPIDGGPAIEVSEPTACTARPANPLDREHITQPLVTGIRAIDGAAALRKRAAHRDFRRQRSRKEHPAGLHVAAQLGRRDGDRDDRRAQPRGARLSGKRTGARRAEAVGGGLRHFGAAGAAARARVLRGAGGGRIFSRPGRQRAAGDGFRYAPGDGAAGNRVGGRRTAQPERLHALRVQSSAASAGARGQFPPAARLPVSSRCW